MKSRRALIFDFDGVLVDSEPVNFAAWNQAFDELLGLRVEDDHLIAVGLTLDETYDLWARTHPTLVLTQELKHKLLARKMELYFTLGKDRLRPMPGSIELLRAAQAAGWYVMVASRARRARLLRTLDLVGMPALFDLVLGAEDIIDPTTDRKDYARPPRVFQIDPAACVVVEDSASGVADARRAGIGCVVGLTTSLAAPTLRAAGAHQIIDRLGDLRLPAHRALPAQA